MKLTINNICMLIVLIILSACKDKVEEKEVVLRPVKYEVVGTSNGQSVRTFSGTVKAGDEIELSFRANGIITELNAKVGQQVKKGDLIAKLDNVQANLAYEQAKSAVRAAQSAMNTSKSNLDRVKSLYEKGSNSLSDYENAKNSYQSALDQFESAKRNRSIQSSQIGYGIIKAPKNGVIASKSASLNENASAGKTIAILNAGKGINVMVGLPENVINKVKLNMETTLNFSAIEGKTFKGTIIEVAPILDVNSATYPVKIDIIKPTDAIKPGMAANITFNFDDATKTTDNTLVVPVKAVGEDGNGKFVFLIISDDGKIGQVKKQVIEIGALTSLGFKILGGLKSGDKIATAGLQSLLDGQKVKLQ
ncbi:efflux RND transporter periplasmic adaptor subunit [Tenacibaculum retecalamus]|uniref:efflux RND transporter periplasmic adaptor subunit n=1 Tax=Tenacibaculum retecalamus TaxID=3018315 RepID=UPI0023D91A27|nr:efflux RND transporter periplasmic adaptor subunit [Tenacibaculum retecalamus]WBX70388.1 efflux RND transporter periplasmic adaptor subunit [Tenacibaculum retecalamus]